MESVETEKALVKRIVDGDPEDFRILIREYRRLVSHIVSRLVSNAADREELGQEIFIKIYRGLPGFRFESNLATWISRIAYRACLNYLRKKRVVLYEDRMVREGSERETSDSGAGAIEEVPSQDSLQDESLMKEQILSFLRREIRTLPVAYRQVVTLHHLEHMSYREIGDVMGLPEGTVKSHMFRARRILKERLLARYDLEELCP